MNDIHQDEASFIKETKEAAGVMTTMLSGKSMAHCMSITAFLIANIGAGLPKKNSLEFLDEMAGTISRYKKIVESSDA